MSSQLSPRVAIEKNKLIQSQGFVDGKFNPSVKDM